MSRSRRAVATATTLMITLGMAAVAAPAANAAGTTQIYTAEGFDASNTDLGDVTADTTFTIDGAGSCTGTACASSVAGTYTVTGDDSGKTDTATLHVDPSALDHIVISPLSFTILVGAKRSYTAAGFDSFGNSLGDVTLSTVFTIDPPPGSCVAARCGSSTPGTYTITGNDSGVTNTSTLHVVAYPPSIKSFLPSSGTVHALVVITGSHFTGVLRGGVTFNGTRAVFILNSDTKITATVPMWATAGAIAVVAPGGTTTSSTEFEVTPTISRFKRMSGDTGSRVVIRGSGFTGTTHVTFNRTPARFHVATDRRIITIVPRKATSGRIRVRTPAGKAHSAKGFKVKPDITGFAPAAGRVGTSVVIEGSGFKKVWRVTFNGKVATFKVKSSVKIVARVPRAKTGPVRVTTAYGTVKTAKKFLVL